MSNHYFPYKSTPFDLPILLFLATAVLALFIAYDWLSAFARFALLVFSVWLYYVITSQPGRSVRYLPKVSLWLGALLALYFFFTNSWQMAPADLTLLQTAARVWMRLTPHLPLPDVHPNQVGGLLAVLFPSSILHLYLIRKNWPRSSLSTIHYLFTWIAALILVGGLLMTGSRGAWLSLFLAAILCLSWLSLRSFAHRTGGFGLASMIVLCLLVLILTGRWLLSETAILHSLLDRLQNSTTVISRLDVYRNTLTLIADFPFTGSGLNTFAGLYSRYILAIPVIFFYYGHNLYLDLLLEQGPLALLAALTIFLSTAYRLIRTTKSALGSTQPDHEHSYDTQHRTTRRSAQISNFLPFALLASLLTLLLHGFVDDPLYGAFGAPFLFLIPALTVSLERFQNSPRVKTTLSRNLSAQPRLLSFYPLGFVALASLGLICAVAVTPPWRNFALANWYTNMGNLSFARYELVSFPGGSLDERYDIPRLAGTRVWFDQAIKYSPNHPGAHYRLGLIAYRLYDFPAAADHFEKAYRAGLHHKGVIKHLAYSYVWSGQLTTAMPLLIQIPEASKEMQAYISWWHNLFRKELSRRAAQAAFALDH